MDNEEKIPKRLNTEHLLSIQLEGYEVLEKEVKISGNSGRVYLPSSWIGGIVKIVRVTPLDNLSDN
ncbi:MAG: DUF2080 family transposase-associated protein [Candidatus Heimdallarchaeota archaeon]|nr:DUF2080 family transposase-associated protein [Candidatus Heimdallarchaeota archaeon]MDH5645810.1 DUF2080 family transposase-associated protein [Candidatus Heimdallarchaeota archaeon]